MGFYDLRIAFGVELQGEKKIQLRAVSNPEGRIVEDRGVGIGPVTDPQDVLVWVAFWQAQKKGKESFTEDNEGFGELSRTATKGFRLAVFEGFERRKERLSRTRTTTKDEDDLVAAATRCDLLGER